MSSCPWRWRLLGRVMYMCKDPDIYLWRWLSEGVPMGLAQEIRPGGLFPTQLDEASTSIEQLDASAPCEKNHPSYHERYGQRQPPSYELLQSQVNSGFALLFHDKGSAEQHLGARVHPAPLGNIAKQKPNGEWKFRLVQYLRINGVNDACIVGERQVLPRGIDHGIDMAVLSAARQADEDVHTLVLDFKDWRVLYPCPKRLASFGQRFRLPNTSGRVHVAALTPLRDALQLRPRRDEADTWS